MNILLPLIFISGLILISIFIKEITLSVIKLFIKYKTTTENLANTQVPAINFIYLYLGLLFLNIEYIAKLSGLL